jgi:hypothetical protein
VTAGRTAEGGAAAASPDRSRHERALKRRVARFNREARFDAAAWLDIVLRLGVSYVWRGDGTVGESCNFMHPLWSWDIWLPLRDFWETHNAEIRSEVQRRLKTPGAWLPSIYTAGMVDR